MGTMRSGGRVFRYIGKVATQIRGDEILAAVEQAAPDVKEEIVTFVDQWIEEGVRRGRAEGEARARRALVGRLLMLKFGPLSPEHSARLAAASDAELDIWAERVLTATTLDQVFAT